MRIAGVDWEAMRGKYTPLLPRANDRRELNDILMQLTAEICALHHFVRGGEMTRPPEASTKPHIPAHLGAILDRCESEQGGGFQVKRIYNGDPERPSSLGPLSKQPGASMPLELCLNNTRLHRCLLPSPVVHRGPHLSQLPP